MAHLPASPRHLRMLRQRSDVPGWEPELDKLMSAFFVLFIWLFILDATHNRLGSSNGKFISFVDTMVNVYSFRDGLPNTTRSAGKGVLHVLRIISASFFIKFAAGTLVSLLIGKVPVVFQGVRHFISFFVGLALLWCAPCDFVFQQMKHSRAVRLVMTMGRGLYKMRKAIYAIETAAKTGGGCLFAFLLAVLTIDGSTLTRRSVLWMEKQFAQKQLRCHRLVGGISLETLQRDSWLGFKRVLLSTVLPLGAITAVVWGVSRFDWLEGITADPYLNLRAFVLVVFAWREGTFDELSAIHVESQEIASISNNKLKATTSSCSDSILRGNSTSSINSGDSEEPEHKAGRVFVSNGRPLRSRSKRSIY